jgi:hypothetical protein
LKNAGFINLDGKIDEDIDIKEFSPEFIKKVNDVTLESFYPSVSYVRKRDEINETYESFNDLRVTENQLHILLYTPLLNVDKIHLDHLKQYLDEKIELLNSSSLGTHFRKLICLYDYLTFINNGN